MEEWRAHTKYAGLFDADTPVIHVFWSMVAVMNQTERAQLLRFVTGSDRLPVGGFAALRGTEGLCPFTITSLDHRSDGLPTAHTCFNRLEIPLYEESHELERALAQAVQEGLRFDLE